MIVNFNNLMKQAQTMQKKLAEMQEELAHKLYDGVAVKVTMTGKYDLKAIKIDPQIVDKEDLEMLEDLIIAAFNDAKKKADEDSQGGLSSMLGGMQMPPGMKLPF